MKRIEVLSQKFCIWALGLAHDVKGQDLIEYALMAGFVAVAAAAAMPNISTTLGTVFSKISSVMTDAVAS
jgi:pilus assembly protein Flp/PilA